MSVDPDQAALEEAVQAAVQQARWEALDLLARKGRQSAPDLLRGRSAELAFVPAGYDQLLSLALDQGARAVDEGAVLMALDLRAMLDPAPLPSARQAAILEQAARCTDLVEANLAGAVAERASDDKSMHRLSPTEQGLLCRRLWSDARIPAGDATRARMVVIGERLARSRETSQTATAPHGRLASWARRLGQRWAR